MEIKNKENGERSIKVKFIFEKILLMELDLTECEILAELRPILLENPLLKLQPNIKFTHNNKKLKEHISLYNQIHKISNKIEILIKQDIFDQRRAEEHVLSLVEFFEFPEKYLYDNFMEFNILIGRTEYLQNQNKDYNIKNDFNIDDLINSNLESFSKISFLEEKKNEDLFFKQFFYSKFNPPSNKAKINGDLLYLEIVTKEDKKFNITINKNGCFLNNSKGNIFNESKKTNKFLSLIDLLKDISNGFEEDIEEFVNPNSTETYKKFADSYKILPTKTKSWLKKLKKFQLKTSQLKNLKNILKPSKYGKNFRTYRDWNEEFQNCKLLPSSPTLQQLHRTKVLRRTNKEFLKSAAKLAKSIIRNEIHPLNPSDSKIENCYVYNNLFATYAKDSLTWEMPKDETSPTTYSAVNSDIKNLQILYNHDLDYINCINTCAIDYLGHRVIVQTVIQGILHFDQKTWNCYGSIDDGKTMNFNEDFHAKMSKVCGVFNLSLGNCFRDQEGKEFVFNGSPEVKGIKAGDGRQYIMDLMRLSVRDANYDDKKEHECCIIRNEVIKNYLFYTKYEEERKLLEKRQKEAQDKLKKESVQKDNDKKEIKNKNEIKNEESPKDEKKEKVEKKEEKVEKKEEKVEKKEKVENQKIEEDKIVEDKIVEKNSNEKTNQKEEIVEKTNNNKNQTELKKFNPSLLTTLESQNENNEEQLEDLKSLGKFLKTNMVSIFLNNLSSNPMLIPMDMEALVDSLHKNGINIRYLGYINNLIKFQKNSYLVKLVEKTIFIRSMRKYFRGMVFEENSETFLKIVIQNLNMILGDDSVRNSIDEKIKKVKNMLENPQNVEKKTKSHKKKNKKKKKKKRKNTIINLEEESNKYLLNSSSEFLNKILDISKRRYAFDPKEIKNYSDLSFLKNKKDKTTFLREFCKSMGIFILPKKYVFSPNSENVSLPIKFEDISGFKVLTKNANFFLEGLKYNFKTIDQEISRGQFEKAFQITKGCQQLIINTYGIYNSDFIYTCSKLASIYFFKKEIDKAISTQNFVIQLSERFYGIDHANTAFAILELSNFYFEKKNTLKSSNLHVLALGIFDFISSSLNPNSLYCLHELQLLFEELKDFKSSLIIMEELFQRNTVLFGKTDEKLLYIMNKLASLKAKINLWKEASILQARHYLILSRLIKNDKGGLNINYKKNLEMKLKESERLRDFYSNKAKTNN